MVRSDVANLAARYAALQTRGERLASKSPIGAQHVDTEMLEADSSAAWSATRALSAGNTFSNEQETLECAWKVRAHHAAVSEEAEDRLNSESVLVSSLEASINHLLLAHEAAAQDDSLKVPSHRLRKALAEEREETRFAERCLSQHFEDDLAALRSELEEERAARNASERKLLGLLRMAEQRLTAEVAEARHARKAAEARLVRKLEAPLPTSAGARRESRLASAAPTGRLDCDVQLGRRRAQSSSSRGIISAAWALPASTRADSQQRSSCAPTELSVAAPPTAATLAREHLFSDSGPPSATTACHTPVPVRLPSHSPSQEDSNAAEQTITHAITEAARAEHKTGSETDTGFETRTPKS
jgi:hypothetical protein